MRLRATRRLVAQAESVPRNLIDREGTIAVRGE